jgi:type III pantothenate kinase
MDQAGISLIIDEGNTRIKLAAFSGRRVIASATLTSRSDIAGFISTLPGQITHALWSSTSTAPDPALLPGISVFIPDASSSLPISVRYTSRKTLGMDRIAGAVAARFLFPDEPLLVIDAGTCITFNVISGAGEFVGGAISPGIFMRLRSMHEFTARLPLADPPFSDIAVGKDTRENLISGAVHGALAEANWRISELNQQYGGLRVILTGGDWEYFDTGLKTPTFADTILTLRGFNEILHFNI